jgi:hypothetical protein
MNFARWTGLAVAAAAIAAPAGAQSGWTTIGRAAAEPEASTGTMQVRWNASFREGMFCVEGHGVKLTDAIVRLQDGSSKVVKVRETLADGGCSKPVVLPRKADVASIDVGYDAASLRGAKAKLQLTAR